MISEQKRRTKTQISAAKMFPEFKRLIEEIIVKAGAIQNVAESSYGWVLDTKAGTILISIQENLSEGPVQSCADSRTLTLLGRARYSRQNPASTNTAASGTIISLANGMLSLPPQRFSTHS